MRPGSRTGRATFLAWAVFAAGCSAAPESPRPAPRSDRGLTLPVSRAECAAGVPDSDGDGLSDRCELEVARAFAPVLVVAAGRCDWDGSVSGGRLGGAYLFGAAPAGEGSVRVAYLPAYYRDCGWSGPKCSLPGVGCAGHSGDSELIALEIRSDGRRWWVEDMMLSAHCFARRRRCAWAGPDALGSVAWLDDRARGAPVVYVASGTHAAYPTRASCDAGHYALDTCDANDTAYRYPIRWERQNIGSRAHPAGGNGCVSPGHVGWGSAMVAEGREECLWDEEGAFRGWQAEPMGTPPTPYGVYLRAVLGW